LRKIIFYSPHADMLAHSKKSKSYLEFETKDIEGQAKDLDQSNWKKWMVHNKIYAGRHTKERKMSTYPPDPNTSTLTCQVSN